MPSRRLLTSVPDDLLRGVRLEAALECFGTHWTNPALSRVRLAGELSSSAYFEKSERVSRLDDFLSHDWQTGRWSKFISLCVKYNAVAAMVGSSLVQVVPFLFGAENTEVHMKCTLSVSAVVFPCLFFFWQQVRVRMCPHRSRFVFLDKLCIHQSDPELKQQGILSLAGFLEKSDQFVLLWSPRYFSRLWCTFELAAWMHLKEDGAENNYDFLPAAWGLIVFSLGFLGTLQEFISMHLPQFRLYMFFIVGILVPYFIYPPAKALAELPAQLKAFSVRSAQCFCCNVGHVHPDTKARMACDRQLIYATLLGWEKDRPVEAIRTQLTEEMETRTAEMEMDAALDSFDASVRLLGCTAFARLHRSPQSTGIRYWHCLMAYPPLTWFVVWDVSALAFLGPKDEGSAVWIIRNMIDCFCMRPCFLMMTLFVVFELARHKCIERYVKLLLLALGISAFWTWQCLWEALLSVEDPLMLVATAMGMGAFTAWFFVLSERFGC